MKFVPNFDVEANLSGFECYCASEMFLSTTFM